MAHNNVKKLKEIAFDMHVLLVEDESEIQEQLKSFLLRFFTRVDTANNGKEALKMFGSNSYDLVITDLTMPYMDGMELTTNIRDMKKSQHIIVISAYSDSEKLIELINIGVDGFILKPINVMRVVQMLLKSCQSVYDHKMLHYFNDLLEQTNAELRESNMELECTLNQIGRLREESNKENNSSDERKNEAVFEVLSRLDDFFTQNDAQDLERANEDLEQIEDDFNLLLISTDRNTTANTLISFNQLLKSYSRVIHLIPQCHTLGYALMQLARQIDGISVQESEEMEYLVPLLTALFDYLEQWRRGIFVYRNVDDIHFMDEYLLKKITEIETSIST